MLLLYKQVDKSVLKDGFSIPISYQEQFFTLLGFSLKHGEKRTITILLNGIKYEVKLINQPFDLTKYPDHGDVLQIRYSPGSPFSAALRQIFDYTVRQINSSIAAGHGSRISKLPENQKEFLALYTTSIPGTIIADPICNSEFIEESAELKQLGEHTAENILDGTDENASIILKTKLCKVRRLSKTISNDLKKAYGYRCQICGQYIGEPYGSNLIHAHHIEYFTTSLNNNANNILIVCPNHHGIIHDCNPIFDYADKTYTYPNGYKEGLLLNKHL